MTSGCEISSAVWAIVRLGAGEITLSNTDMLRNVYVHSIRGSIIVALSAYDQLQTRVEENWQRHQTVGAGVAQRDAGPHSRVRALSACIQSTASYITDHAQKAIRS